MSEATGRPCWWETRWFAAAVILVMAVPLLWPQTPPLTDLFAHMGRYKIQLELADSPELQRFYDFKWALIGNLGADLLVVPLAPLVGLEAAVKFIAIAVPVTGAVGLIWLSFEVHGRTTPTVLFALPFLFGNPFNFGFLNFMLGMSIVLNALALWIRLGKQQRPIVRAVIFIPIAGLTWVTHSAAWALLCLACFASEFAANVNAGRGFWNAGRAAAIASLTLAFPLLLTFVTASDPAGTAWALPDLADKYLLFQMALRDRWQTFDVLSVFAAVAVLGLLAVSRSFTVDRRLLAVAVTLFAVFLVVPSKVLGSAYVDMRLIPFVLIFALVALAPLPGASWRAITLVAIAGLLFLLARLGGNTLSYVLYDRLHRETLTALASVPEGARVLTLVGRSGDVAWYTDRREHIASMLIVRRRAFANDQFDGVGAQLLSICKADAAGFIYDGSQLVRPNGSRVNKWRTVDDSLRTFPRTAFDYLWLIEPPPFDARLVAKLQPVWQRGADTLYRIPAAAVDSPTGRSAALGCRRASR